MGWIQKMHFFSDKERKHGAPTKGLEAAFTTSIDGVRTDEDTFWQPFSEETEILDEDFPRRMSGEVFIEHINFLAGGESL